MQSDRFEENKDSRLVHLSIDDIGASLRWACLNLPQSIWDMRFFGKLKELNMRYGAEFTLYCYYDIGNNFCFDSLPAIYLSEFSQAENWLKFGFHATNKLPFSQASDWEKHFAKFSEIIAVHNIGGTDILRVHCWETTDAQECYLQKSGIRTLLIRKQEDDYIKNGIYHRSTNTCFEKISSAISDLVLEIGKPHLIAFTHEWIFEQQISKIESSIELYVNSGYGFFS